MARRKIFKKLGISFSVFVLLILGLEVGLRIAGYGKALARYYDPQLGWFYLPHQERGMLGPKKEFLGMMKTNAEGFRGPVATSTKKDGVTRIACLGDSFTHGWGVAGEETYPAQLQRELPEAEVLNYGIPGANIWNSLQVYRFKVRDKKPDVAIFALFENDAQPDTGGPKHMDAWILTAFGRTAIVEAFNLHLRNRISYFHAGRSPELKAYLQDYRKNERDILSNPESEVASRYWTKAMENLRTLSEEVQADGVRFVVIQFPSHRQWVKVQKAKTSEEEALSLEGDKRLQAYVRREVEALGVPYLDLYDTFAASPEDPFNPLDQGHPSKIGYDLASKRISAWLRELGLD